MTIVSSSTSEIHSTPQMVIRPERAEDAAAVENLTYEIFGPGMTARAAYVLREGVNHEMALSFVAVQGDALIGTVRLTKIWWGDQACLMLGPLGVRSGYKKQGAGRALMEAAVNTAKAQLGCSGCSVIMLVGDYEYYAPFGFVRVGQGKIVLPRPADPARILACELEPGSLVKFQGVARRWSES